ncbi:hypothetical protein V1264_017726 [Littorina saxatilis]|uniref:Uncharacterized protein n=2 Tax=Littorina saxatilis TaxID=31220 RepID=A0AAN9BJV0_9CAEN
MYDTSDGPNDTHSADNKPSAIALPMSPNSHTGHPAAPHSLEAHMCTTVDGEARHAPNSAADRLGAIEDIGFGSNGNKREPQKDEYAVVDKSKAQKGPACAANTSAIATSNAGADVYAQVNKPAKKVKVAEPDTEGAAYAQVQKPKPAVKPKTLAKPSSNKDVSESSAADDDEYHTPSHTRGSRHTQDQADLESQYSYIGHD